MKCCFEFITEHLGLDDLIDLVSEFLVTTVKVNVCRETRTMRLEQ